jgi:hypothetical protein
MKLKVWLDSGANIHSCRTEIVEFTDLGVTEAEWDALTEAEQEGLAKEIAFDRADWGFAKVEDDEDGR